jgi:hypothetical protein
MKLLLVILSLMLIIGCHGRPHLELAAVRSTGPSTIDAYFSEPVAESNNRTDLFTVINASTGKDLELASVSASGQTVTITLASRNVLSAGHVYDLHYDVAALENSAKASARERFLADFLPPKNPLGPLEVFRDSTNNVLLLWVPDNRIGNTATHIWKRWRKGKDFDSTQLASIEPNRSTYRTSLESGQSPEYGLRFANEFGKSDISNWSSPVFASVRLFPCMNTCLENQAWDSLPAHFVPMELTCDMVMYKSDSIGEWWIRRITEGGIKEIRVDSTGAMDTLDVNGCLP